MVDGDGFWKVMHCFDVDCGLRGMRIMFGGCYVGVWGQ